MGAVLKNPLSDRFTVALGMAATIHRTQARKGTDVPYVSHVMAVAAIALEFEATEDEAIGALLHDAIEDAPDELAPRGEAAGNSNQGEVVRRLIRFEFGEKVLAIVEACSDADVQPKPAWRVRKEAYIAAIGHKSASALLVSAADKVHNARAILRDFRAMGTAVFGKFNPDAGKAGTLGYYRGLVGAIAARARELGDLRVLRLSAELAREVDALEAAVGERGEWPMR